jgi:hypothetical protein
MRSVVEGWWILWKAVRRISGEIVWQEVHEHAGLWQVVWTLKRKVQ